MKQRSLAAPLLVLLVSLAFAQTEYGPSWPPRVALRQSPHPRQNVNWSQEIVYFLLIDRFCNGDPSNDDGGTPASHILYLPEQDNRQALKTYQGGDLQGVIDRLDYLQDLGVTTIWLSPLFDNSNTDFNGWWPYHGYSPVDFFKVDEHFGDMALLQKLVNRAHARRMKIVLDMIYNHTAPDHPWVVDRALWQLAGYRHWFHPHSGVDGSTSIVNWQDQDQLENRELNGLPDLAQENPHVYDFLLDVSKYWIVQTGCDGFRLDAVKHIAKPFWRKLCADLHAFSGANFLLLGEVFSGETDYVAGYQELGFNALFDIPMYYSIHRVFAQSGMITLLGDQLAANQAAYPQLLLSPLMDNHDVARFSYWAQDHVKEKIKSSLTFLLTTAGMPMIYYGTEMASAGAAANHEQTGEGQDYLNRRMMDWQAVTNQHPDLVTQIRKLTASRKKFSALSGPDFLELYKDYGVYAYLRHDGHEALLVLLNNASTLEQRRIGLPGAVFSQGRFLDLLSGKKYRATRDSLDVALTGHASLLLRYRGDWQPDLLAPGFRPCSFTPRLTGDRQWATFTYQTDQPLSSVAVAGDFNGWSKDSARMHYDPARQSWNLRLALSKGRYRYKLILDGRQWIADPLCRETERDPYGGSNSVIILK